MKIYNIEIHFNEILLIFCVLFFTIIMNYVDVSPYIKDIARKDRFIQLLAVFIISLTFIMSFKSTMKININFVVNALIVTVLFGFITKPKNMLKKELDIIKSDIEVIKAKHNSQSKPLMPDNKIL